MKKLFGRRSASMSESRRSQRNESNPELNSDNTRVPSPSSRFPEENSLTVSHSVPESDTLSVMSMALSETETLALTRNQSSRLQDTYMDNFTSYIPFLLERHRAAMRGNETTRESPIIDSDDERTMISETDERCFMGRPITRYNHKRTMVIASELIKNTTYVFPNAESFELFKELRTNLKKLRKNSIVLYDENSNVRRVYSRRNSQSDGALVPSSRRRNSSKIEDSKPFTSVSDSADLTENGPEKTEKKEKAGKAEKAENCNIAKQKIIDDADITTFEKPRTRSTSGPKRPNSQGFSEERFARCIIDSRSHIVPLDYKVKGHGLPLLKVVVPYLSTFRRKTPYMIFRRYLEKPQPPSESDAIEDEHFETYDFCTVHSKSSQHYKRYIFEFCLEDGTTFQVIAFQNTYRPFTDFNYKNTRFRVFGTSVTMAYLTPYNPELKLRVLDDSQASLLDNLIEKKPENDIFSRGKKKESSGELQETSPTDTHAFKNPVPDPQNPIIRQNLEGGNIAYYNNSTPHESPLFSQFSDSCVYLRNASLIPKKYSEVGKIEMYQDSSESATPDYSSSLSVDLDSLVLTTVFLTLRETNLRTTVKSAGQSNAARAGILTAMALGGGGIMSTAAVA